jgi:hypothetical protein
VNFIDQFKYAWLTTKHKYFVFLAGLKTKTSLWQLIIHDLSKYGRDELPHYGRQFFGDKSDPEGFMCCWLHHQNYNPHHWEYWFSRSGHTRSTPPLEHDGTKPLPMPEKYVREMVADWMGASKAYEGKWPKRDEWEWLNKNLSKVRLHPRTCVTVCKVMYEIGHTVNPFAVWPNAPWAECFGINLSCVTFERKEWTGMSTISFAYPKAPAIPYETVDQPAVTNPPPYGPITATYK